MSNLDIVRPETSSWQWVGRLLIWAILLLFCFLVYSCQLMWS